MAIERARFETPYADYLQEPSEETATALARHMVQVAPGLKFGQLDAALRIHAKEVALLVTTDLNAAARLIRSVQERCW